MQLETSNGEFTLYGLVRDKNGKPRIDDINNIPEQIWNMLTKEEQEEIKRNGSNINT